MKLDYVFAKSLWYVTRAFVCTVRAILHPRKTYHKVMNSE